MIRPDRRHVHTRVARQVSSRPSPDTGDGARRDDCGAARASTVPATGPRVPAGLPRRALGVAVAVVVGIGAGVEFGVGAAVALPAGAWPVVAALATVAGGVAAAAGLAVLGRGSAAAAGHAAIGTGSAGAVGRPTRSPGGRPVDGSTAAVAGAGPGDGADPAVLSLVADPYATVEGTHRRLRALERLFRERGDRRAVFLTVYARVTGAVGAAIDRGAFEDPAWVADYLVTFANIYRRALLADETGRTAALPTAWRLAFRAAERDRTLVVQHAALGIDAHVAFDLAFALAAVGLDGDRRRKYRDHWRINLVLWRLVGESVDRLAARYAPGLATLDDAVGPLVEWCWFGALLAGREAAWWVAVALTDARSTSAVRAARWVAAAASTAVARVVLLPTAHPIAARATACVARRLGLRRL